jgi:flagellar assembly protein FliH
VFPATGEIEREPVVEVASFPNLDPRADDHTPFVETEEFNTASATTLEADARQEARRLLLSARREGELLVDKARREAEEIRARARAEGCKSGEEKVREEFRREVFPLIDILKHAIEELDAVRHLYSGQLETQIPTLTLLLTKKVIQRELEIDKSTIAGIVRAALDRVSGNGREVTLRLNPKDAEILANHRGDLLEGLDKIQGILVESDASISTGGCLIETANGLVDARLETQLEEAARVLEGGGE